MTSPPPVLVLDLDGTLVDTIDDLVATLNAVLAREGMPQASRERVQTFVGKGARAMLEAAFAAEQKPVGAEQLEALYTAYIAHYAANVCRFSKPFPGAEAMLDRFATAGWRLAICTNKLEGLSRELLRALGLADRFAAVAGQDTFPFKKPDPRHLIETIRSAGGSPPRAVMVGDSAVDVETAKAASVPIVAVAFGYTAQPVAQLGADRTISHFDELWDTVVSLPVGTASP